MTATRILGIDPGTRTLGYGVLEVDGGAARRAVDAGALRLPGSIPERLERIFVEIRRLSALHAPRVLALERVFHGRNVQSIFKLGEARGVVLLAGRLEGLEIHEFTPAEVKKTVTGNGNADKTQVQRMVARVLGLAELPEPTDVSDALAVAFSCAEALWKAERLGGIVGRRP
jgi:crossover junction endodeoxyribonuclease RuvC